MSRVRWPGAPADRRRATVKVENLALVPASLLPHKATYQRLANQLPVGAVLVVLPAEDTPEKQTLQTAAARLLAKGHPVTTLAIDEVLALTSRRRRPRPAGIAPPPESATPPVAPSPPVAPITAAPLRLPARTTPPVPDVPDVPPFTHELRLVSIDASRNRARFYLLQWQPSLWGSMMLVRVWGRLGGPGRLQVVQETETAQVDAAVTRLIRERLRHGYHVVDWH